MNTHDMDMSSRRGEVEPPPLDSDRGKIEGQRKSSRKWMFPVVLIALAILAYFINDFYESIQKSTVVEKKGNEEIVSSLPVGLQAEKPRAGREMKMPPPEPPVEVKSPIEVIVPTITGRDYSKMGPVVTQKPVDPWAAARTPSFTQGEQREGNGSGGMLPMSQGGSESSSELGTVPREKLGNEQFADRLRPTPTGGERAKKIVNPSLTITKGTHAKCVLQTAVKTDVIGEITCKVKEDVYSTDGKVVLMRKDSFVVGEYQNGLEMGEETIFVLWTRYEDKQTHVTIDLNSPGTDELGRAGMTGRVNTKFWQRIGGAIAVSLIGDISSLVGRGNGNTTVNAFSNTTGAATDIAKSVLDIYKNVRPTMEKDEGSNVNILFARDLDFSPVYRLRKVTKE